MKINAALCDVTWDEVHQAFAPFVGTCLYAIRAEAFFHFSLQKSQPKLFALKNSFFPAVAAWRSFINCPQHTDSLRPYVLICDYSAAPGFGTLLPLLQSCDGAATLIVNSRVLTARTKELARLRNVRTVCADSAWLGTRLSWPSLWRKSYEDYMRLREASPTGLQSLLIASRRVLQTLLVRAYLYENFYEKRFAVCAPQGVITHNDFTALSYLAGKTARRMKIPDFTLQHGFPSQEYFPASASHYLVWGPIFQQMMRGGALNGTRIALTGAPRLDAVTFAQDRKKAVQNKLSKYILHGKMNVLFLSQSHTSLFSNAEHDQILSLAGSLAEKYWVNMLLRRHPQESKGAFRSHRGLKRAVMLPAEIPLDEAVLAADAVVSVNSTAMLEAALLHAPVIQLALPSFEERLGPLRFPCQASDLASAQAVLWNLLDPRERAACVRAQQSLIDDCVHNPGSGAANVWRYIREHSSPDHMPVAEATSFAD